MTKVLLPSPLSLSPQRSWPWSLCSDFTLGFLTMAALSVPLPCQALITAVGGCVGNAPVTPGPLAAPHSLRVPGEPQALPSSRCGGAQGGQDLLPRRGPKGRTHSHRDRARPGRTQCTGILGPGRGGRSPGTVLWPSLHLGLQLGHIQEQGHQLREDVPRHVMLPEAGSVQKRSPRAPLKVPCSSRGSGAPSSGSLWFWAQAAG